MKDLEQIHKLLNKNLICQKCNGEFYAHGGSKYCVICKPLMMETHKREQNKRIRELNRKLQTEKITFVPPASYIKRKRAKAIKVEVIT